MVEAEKLEKMLLGDYAASAGIFDLKNNHGYTDKQEVNQTGNVKPVIVNFVGDDFTPEQ